MERLHNATLLVAAANALISEGRLHPLKALVDLTNLEKSLTLTVPGFGKPSSFTLAQSSEVILSILCMEIPYVISDLLCVIKLPVFYQGLLAMEINGQLCLLGFTSRSLETDLNSLKLQVSQRNRVDLERRFWLKYRRFSEFEARRRVWCPAKETYKRHLRKLIDCKLCRRIVESEAIQVGRRFGVVRALCADRKFRDQNLLNGVKLTMPSNVSARTCFPSARQRCLPSIFSVQLTPYEIVAGRDSQRQRNFRSSTQKLKVRGEQWFEVYCDGGRNSSMAEPKFAKKIKIEPTESSYENDSPSKCEVVVSERINGEAQTSKISPPRRVAVRIMRGLTGHFWALPILPAEATKLDDDLFQNDAQNNSAYAPQPSFLGLYADCQEYMARLFASLTEPFLKEDDTNCGGILEVVQPLNRSYDDYAELMGVLPRKFGLAMSNNCGLNHDALLLGLSGAADQKSPSENDDSNFERVFERIRVFCADVRTTRSRLIHSLRFEAQQQRVTTIKQENF